MNINFRNWPVIFFITFVFLIGVNYSNVCQCASDPAKGPSLSKDYDLSKLDDLKNFLTDIVDVGLKWMNNSKLNIKDILKDKGIYDIVNKFVKLEANLLSMDNIYKLTGVSKDIFSWSYKDWLNVAEAVLNSLESSLEK